MSKGRYFYQEIVAFAAMVLLQFLMVGLTTLFKAAASKGMSSHVFLVYSYSIAALVLLPFAYIFDRKKQLPPINLSFLGRALILGLIGYLSQVMGFKGIKYSSPTLASVMSNLTPAITFVLAIIFRMEKIKLSNLSSRAKIIGTIISVSGGLAVVLYEGPTVIRSLSSSSSVLSQPLTPEQSDWVIGGLLLAGEYILICIWYIAQAKTVRMYPADLLVASVYNLSAAVIAIPVALVLETDYSLWRISSRIMLITILYSGFCGFALAILIVTWGLHLKGPVYVAIFHPLTFAIASFTTVIFLGESLHLGSIIGAVIMSIGFYVVIWGKAKEASAEEDEVNSLESTSTTDITTPLL